MSLSSQSLSFSHSQAFRPMQLPDRQMSPSVQSLLSSQTAPLYKLVYWQMPFWHEATLHITSAQSLALLHSPVPHVFGPGWHAPDRQVSGFVQLSPSSQGVPLRTVYAHFITPARLDGAHISSVHSLLSSQSASELHSPILHVSGPGWHAPDKQVSGFVHGSPSLHGVLVRTVCAHFRTPLEPDGSHVSSVQSFPSLQFASELHAVPLPPQVSGPGWHTPDEQVSGFVQLFPSSQLTWFGMKTQPDEGLHKSSVHGLASLQTNAVCWHIGVRPEVMHISVVHELPSLQPFVQPQMFSPPVQTPPEH